MHRTNRRTDTCRLYHAPATIALVAASVLFAASAPTSAGPIAAAYRPDLDKAVGAWLDGHLAETVEFYKTLHAAPELSFEEKNTADVLADKLRDAGCEVTAGVGGTGLVAVLRSGDGPTVLFRTDLDALPVTEETGLPYASQVTAKRPDGSTVGVMHACGHDIHMANFLATAQVLASLRDRWRGTVVFIAQPAEEIGLGAQKMIEDGLFERFPRPRVCLALHVNQMAAGTVGVTPGYGFANVDSVDITVFGRGGHGAWPEQTADPIVASAYLITNLQTLVSRRVKPIEAAVVTVGSIHGGSKHNIIPDEVRLQLTVRCYSEETRKLLLDGIRQIAVDTARTFRCPRDPEVVVRDEHTPSSYNDPDLTSAAADVFRQAFGEANVVQRPPVMGGEDFGHFAKHLNVPGLQFWLGALDPALVSASEAPDGPPLPTLHSSKFAPLPDLTLRTGVRATANLIASLLDPT